MNNRFHIGKLNGAAANGSFPGRFTLPIKNGDFASAWEKPVTPRSPDGAGPEGKAKAAVKRLYDMLFAFCGLILLSPLFAAIAMLVKLGDGGYILYRQVRIGRGGREFWIYKFRTMVPSDEKAGPSITKRGDARVTWIGRILRKSKLDELPQLWNVLKGEMSLVGPRPEVPRYVHEYTPEQRAILRHKPGITDLASLCFRDEEALLANAENVEDFYVRHCIPRKLRLNQEYAARANLVSDTWIILQTICPYWAGVLACYGIILAASFGLACGLVDNFAPDDFSLGQFGRYLCSIVGLQLVCLMWRRQCRGLLSYFSFPEARKVGVALGLTAIALLGWSASNQGEPPANIILLDALLSFCMLSGFRFLLRRWRERSARRDAPAGEAPTRVGIIGAGSAGAQLALELSGNPGSGRTVVAFFDDDFHKWQKSIHDVPVAGMPECLSDGWAERLDEVVIAAPDTRAERVGEIKQLLRKTHLKFYVITSPFDLWNRRHSA